MKKILLIENEINGITPVKEKLAMSGYEVIKAEDGIKGIHIVHKENPDLIILEYLLPNINGCEVCSLLKRDIMIFRLSCFRFVHTKRSKIRKSS